MYEFDFVFSFAGEDRDIVVEIKDNLAARNYKVFYYEDFQAELIGEDLYKSLREVYHSKGKFVVCFISESYKRKKWTALEFTAVKERFLDTFFAEGFLMPILIDDTALPEDIPSFIGFYRHETVEKTADLLHDKMKSHIKEDSIAEDIQKLIEYIQDNVLERLKRHRYCAETPKSKITVHTDVQTKEFQLVGDTLAQSPCILLFSSHNIKFPLMVITWRKHPYLRFFINMFAEYADETPHELSYDELVSGVCDYIERYIEGDLY
jgi:hypothetical protein